MLEHRPNGRNQPTMSTTSVARMSHRSDPDTSHDAAERASKGPKKALIQGAILTILETGPATPREILAEYIADRRDVDWLPEADLYDIRRRMTELEHDLNLIESIVESPGHYLRRDGQRVMRLAKAVA